MDGMDGWISCSICFCLSSRANILQMMSRRSNSTDRSSLGPLRVRTDNNKPTSGRRSRSTDAKGRPSNIGRPSSGNRSSFGAQSGIPRRSVVGQVSKFGQGLQTQKSR